TAVRMRSSSSTVRIRVPTGQEDAPWRCPLWAPVTGLPRRLLGVGGQERIPAGSLAGPVVEPVEERAAQLATPEERAGTLVGEAGDRAEVDVDAGRAVVGCSAGRVQQRCSGVPVERPFDGQDHGELVAEWLLGAVDVHADHGHGERLADRLVGPYVLAVAIP